MSTLTHANLLAGHYSSPCIYSINPFLLLNTLIKPDTLVYSQISITRTYSLASSLNTSFTSILIYPLIESYSSSWVHSNIFDSLLLIVFFCNFWYFFHTPIFASCSFTSLTHAHLLNTDYTFVYSPWFVYYLLAFTCLSLTHLNYSSLSHRSPSLLIIDRSSFDDLEKRRV